MPNIHQYTAQTKPAVPNQPLRFMESGEDPTLQLAEKASNITAAWAGIAGRVEAQQRSAKYGIEKSRFNTDVKSIHMNLVTDPEVQENPLLYEEKFGQQLRDLRASTNERIKDPVVRGMMDVLYAQEGPEQLLEARVIGLKMTADHNLALLGVSEETNSKLAAESIATGNPSGATDAINDHTRQVADAVANGHLTKVQGQQRIKTFKEKTLQHEMFLYAKGGSASRDKLRDKSRNGEFDMVDPVTHVNMLELANREEHREELRTAAVMKKADEQIIRNIVGLTHMGPDFFSQAQIDLIKQNKTVLDPSVGEHLQEIRNKQLAGEQKKVRDPVVGVIANEFGAQGPPTMERNLAERAALTKHVLINGPSEDSKIRYDHLDAQYNVMQSNAIAARQRGIADTTREVNRAEDYADKAFDSSRPPIIGGPSSRRRQDMIEKNAKAELQRYLQTPTADRSQEGIDRWIKQYRERQKKRYDDKTDQQKKSDQFSGENR